MSTNSNGEGAPSRSYEGLLRIDPNIPTITPDNNGPHEVPPERRRRHRMQKKQLIERARQLLLAPRPPGDA